MMGGYSTSFVLTRFSQRQIYFDYKNISLVAEDSETKKLKTESLFLKVENHRFYETYNRKYAFSLTCSCRNEAAYIF